MSACAIPADLPIIDYQLSFLFILAGKQPPGGGGGSEHSICQQKEISTLIKENITMNEQSSIELININMLGSFLYSVSFAWDKNYNI